jgi:hypothetical protein
MYVEAPPSAIVKPQDVALTIVVAPAVNAIRSYAVFELGLSSQCKTRVSPEYQLVLEPVSADEAVNVSGSSPS